MPNPILDESEAAFVRDPHLAEPAPALPTAVKHNGANGSLKAVGKALDKTKALAESAISSIDQTRRPAARVLQNVAASMHEAAPRMPGGDRVVRVVHNAAHGMNSTARYVRQHNLSRMASDLTRMIRCNPEQAMLTALAVGFIAGMAFSNNNED
jgi:hypothetical protein